MIIIDCLIAICLLIIASRLLQKSKWGKEKGEWYKICLSRSLVLICAAFYLIANNLGIDKYTLLAVDFAFLFSSLGAVKTIFFSESIDKVDCKTKEFIKENNL